MIIEKLNLKNTQPINDENKKTKYSRLMDNYHAAAERIDRHPIQRVMEESLLQAENALELIANKDEIDFTSDLQNDGNMISLADDKHSCQEDLDSAKDGLSQIDKNQPSAKQNKRYYKHVIKQDQQHLDQLDNYAKKSGTDNLILDYGSGELRLNPQVVKDFILQEMQVYQH